MQQELSSKSHNSCAERKLRTLRGLAFINARPRFSVAGETRERGFCPWDKTPGAGRSGSRSCPSARRNRGRKIHITVQSFLNLAPVGKLSSTVAGNGLDQLGREGRQRGDNGVLHGLRSSVRHLHCNVKPGFAFCKGGKTDLALSLAAHYRILFPVPGLMTAVHRLVLFTDRLSLVVFAPDFFYSVTLSLAAQHFQVTIYQTFLIDPARSSASLASSVHKGYRRSASVPRRP